MTSCGLPLPCIAFIVWPTKKPNNASLPALNSATLSALAASTRSAAASIASESTAIAPESETIQLICAAEIVAISEASVVAERAGLDLATLLDLLQGGYAGSTILADKTPKLVGHDYSVSAQAAFVHKDVSAYLDAGYGDPGQLEVVLSEARLSDGNVAGRIVRNFVEHFAQD